MIVPVSMPVTVTSKSPTALPPWRCSAAARFFGVAAPTTWRLASQHKTKAIPGFTARYGCDKLVWYEVHESRESAFQRERRIKEWRRSWKQMLIEETNPTWADLYESLA